MESARTDVAIKCADSKERVKLWSKKKYHYFYADRVKDCGNQFNDFATNLNKSTCYNVLTNALYHFFVNGSDVVKVKAEFVVTNVNLEKVNESNKDLGYIVQNFNVKFEDVLNSSGNSGSDGSYDRGYFFGEDLNFGNTSGSREKKKWEKGFIGVFINGGNCNDTTAATFGYDTSSICRFRHKLSNCTLLRNAVRERFDDLIKGGFLAPHRRFESPDSSNPIPVLRSYTEQQWNETGNITNFCPVIVRQSVTIQYTSILVKNGHFIHHATGLKLDRLFGNVTFTEGISLASQITFAFVPFPQRKTLSRFWERVDHPEKSENAWIYLFKAFDEDLTGDDLEEITFWGIGIAISLCLVWLLPIRNVNH